MILTEVRQQTNPFYGPNPIPLGRRLFGRDWETRMVRDLLVSRRLALLHSPSGAGKTSLIQAGLWPAMEDEFELRGPIRVNAVPDAAHASATNRYVYSTLLALGPSGVDGLPDPRLQDYAALPIHQGKPELWIFDQFEEVLTLDPTDEKVKRDFFLQLCDVLGSSRVDPRWALFAMREDYLGAMEPYLKLLPTGLTSRFRLDLLDRESAQLAITGPLGERRVDIRSEVVDRLLEDLSFTLIQQPDGTLTKGPGPYIEPVHLQVVCSRLWEQRADLSEPIENLGAIGNVNAALIAYYREKVKAIAGGDRRAELVIRTWISEWLITPSGVRGQVMLDSEKTKDLDNATIRSLVDAYVLRSEQRRGVTWFELAHDRLIDPVREDNREWLANNLTDFERRAAAWAADPPTGGRFLLKRHELLQFNRTVRTTLGTLQPGEQRFLDESQNAANEQRVRTWLLIAAGAFVLAIIVGILALQYYNTQRQAKFVEAGTLAASAVAELSDDPDISVLLAQKAVESSPKPTSPEAAYALRLSLAQSHVRAVLRGHGIPPLGGDGARIGPPTPCVNTGESQDCAVYTAAVSADGRRVLSAGGDRTARIWNLNDSTQLVLGGHAARVTWATFLPDGDHAFTTSDDGTARIWDARSGREVVSLPNPGGLTQPILGAAYDFDQGLYALGTSDGTIRVWHADLAGAPQLVSVLRGHTNAVNSVQFSPDGKYLASAGSDSTARVWDPRTGDQLLLLAHDGPVNVAAYSQDGLSIVTGGADRAVRLWDASSGKLVTTMTGHAGEVNSVLFDPSGALIVSVGKGDGPARIWDRYTGAPIVTLQGHAGAVFAASFSPDGRFLVTAGEDGTARVWDTATGRNLSVLRGHTDWVYSAIFSSDGTSIVTSSADGTSRVWDAGLGQTVLDEPPPPVPHPTALTVDGALEATIDTEGTRVVVRARGASSGISLQEPNVHSAGPLGALMAPGEPLFQTPVRPLKVAFNPDGSLLASTDSDGMVRVWSMQSGQLVVTLQGYSNGAAWSAGFSSDGSRLIASTLDEAHAYPLEMFAPLDKVIEMARVRASRVLDDQEIVSYEQLALPSARIPMQRGSVSNLGFRQ